MADEVVNEIKEAGGRAVANYDSVAEPEGAENIIKTAIDEFGEVDGVVSNAGILRDGTFHKMTFENWDAVLKVHLYGGYNVHPRRVAALPRAELRPRRRRDLDQRPVRQLRAGQLRRRQARPRRPDQHAGPGRREVQHQGQRRRADRRDPHDAGHPAARGVREADARVRRAGGGLPVHRGSARHRLDLHRRRRQGAAHRAVPERRRDVHRGAVGRRRRRASGARSPTCRRRSRPASSSADPQ